MYTYMVFIIVPRPLLQRKQQRGVRGEVHAVRVHDTGSGGRLRRVVLAALRREILHRFVHLEIVYFIII